MERWGETIIGAVVVAVAAVFFSFAAAQAGQNGGARAEGYPIFARFQRADGVAPGTDVRVSGVKVGVVQSVAIDPTTFFARVDMWIDRGVEACADETQPAEGETCSRTHTQPIEVLDDSTARVTSDGLLGGNYIAIEPAGLDPLPPGGEIINTNGSVDLLTLLSGMLQSAGSSDDATETEDY